MDFTIRLSYYIKAWEILCRKVNATKIYRFEDPYRNYLPFCVEGMLQETWNSVDRDRSSKMKRKNKQNREKLALARGVILIQAKSTRWSWEVARRWFREQIKPIFGGSQVEKGGK